jgi:hypothetical protein
MPISTTLEISRLSGPSGPSRRVVARRQDLPHDLGRGQVAHQPLRAGVAKGAGQRAADLEETQSVPRSSSGM